MTMKIKNKKGKEFLLKLQVVKHEKSRNKAMSRNAKKRMIDKK